MGANKYTLQIKKRTFSYSLPLTCGQRSLHLYSYVRSGFLNGRRTVLASAHVSMLKAPLCPSTASKNHKHDLFLVLYKPVLMEKLIEEILNCQCQSKHPAFSVGSWGLLDKYKLPLHLQPPSGLSSSGHFPGCHFLH